MNSGKSIFAQLMDFLPSKAFRRCVTRYQGDYKLKSFSCWDQFLCMAFAQLTYRESLRDIEACLRAQQTKLYHLGIRGQVSRNTLAHANTVRDWRIYADFAQVLITRARGLYADDNFGIELAQTVYALDATTIDLCLALFPWAKFRKHKGAVKLHTLLDLRGNIPTVVIITHGKVHEVNILDQLHFEAGAFYVMDRGYLDFARLYKLHLASAFFVTRAKKRFDFQRLYSQPVDRTTGGLCDQTVTLVNPVSQPIRRVAHIVTSGPYRTSQTPDAENNAQHLTEEDKGKRNRVLPKVNLSPAEGDFPKIVSARFRQGFATNVVLLKKSLNQQGKWTKGFRPLSIDDRVLRNGNDPTLLGIWHADRNTIL